MVGFVAVVEKLEEVAAVVERPEVEVVVVGAAEVVADA